jgi:hypothetical protein
VHHHDVASAGELCRLRERRRDRTSCSVFVDVEAHVLGDTPLVEVLLPVGRHRLRLVNAAEKVDSFIEVTIKARETTVKKIAF